MKTKLRFILVLWCIFALWVSVGDIHPGMPPILDTLTYINIIPFDFIGQFAEAVKVFPQNAKIGYYMAVFWNLSQNFWLTLLMYLPFGIILKMVTSIHSLKRTLISALVFSGLIECLQFILLMFNLRISVIDINDIIASLAGAAIAYLFTVLAECGKITKEAAI